MAQAHYDAAADAAAAADTMVQHLDDDVGPLTTEEEYARVQRLADRIEGRIGIDKVTRHVNCKDIGEAVATINEGIDHPASESIIGRLVPPGFIAFAERNGETTVVGPGRYLLPSPRASWVSEHNIHVSTQNVIRQGPVTILRIPVGQYAVCRLNNEPLLIEGSAEGMYVSTTGFFQFQRFEDISTPHIQEGVLHVVRVKKGEYCCVMENEVPAILPRGFYCFKSSTFSVKRFVDMSREESFRHETITRFYVRGGSIGLGWKDNAPALFDEPGVYMVDSAMFVFEKSVQINHREISLGSRKIITVHDGEVGISHDNGVLKVLPPGRHFIEKPGHLFSEFLSTQQQCLLLTKDDRHSDSLMVCETSELVRIGVQASIFYNIQNPKLAITRIGCRRNIEHFINESATAVITTIVRSTSLAEIAQGGAKGEEGRKARAAARKQQLQLQRDAAEAAQAAAEGTFAERTVGEEVDLDDFTTNLPFFDRVQGDFLGRLQENFLREYGIHMLNVRIGDFKVLDDEISRSIAAHALYTAETQANLANLEGRRQIDLVNKDSDARIERIQADVDAYKTTTKSKAEADATRDTAAAKANATELEAEANAKAIRAVGEAEAEAAKLKGEAEADRAAKLGASELGREEALARLQCEMVKGALQGVNKVVYLPTEMQRNPFAFFDRDSLATIGSQAAFGSITHPRAAGGKP